MSLYYCPKCGMGMLEREIPTHICEQGRPYPVGRCQACGRMLSWDKEQKIEYCSNPKCSEEQKVPEVNGSHKPVHNNIDPGQTLGSRCVFIIGAFKDGKPKYFELDIGGSPATTRIANEIGEMMENVIQKLLFPHRMHLVG